MMEHYPNLKKGESVDLEGFKFKLVNIEQGFMRWFLVSKIAKDTDKKQQIAIKIVKKKPNNRQKHLKMGAFFDN